MHRRFGGTYCLHLPFPRVSQGTSKNEAELLLVARLALQPFDSSSETSMEFYKPTWSYIPDSCELILSTVEVRKCAPKAGVTSALEMPRLTNTLEFMKTIPSKALGGANAHWPRFQRHLTNTTRVNGSVYINVPNAASLCSADCKEGVNELRERYRKNADVNSRSDTRSKRRVATQRF
jgi:hypothetical protein